MSIDNMGGRCAAILLAAVLAAGGASLLFGDVIFGAAAFTQKHFQTICIVLAATGAAHCAAVAWKQRHLLACLGFIALSGVCVAAIAWYSLGRQTEVQMLSADDHDKAAEQRLRLKEQLDADTATHKAKRTDADALCKKHGPDHKRCVNARALEAVYMESIAGIEARLAALKVRPADASAEAFGRLAGAIGYDAGKAKALSLLFMPYVLFGLFELGFTVSLHYAFRPSRRASKQADMRNHISDPTTLGAVTDAELVTLRHHFTTETPKGPDGGLASTIRGPKGPNSPKGGAQRLTQQEIIADLMLRAVTGQTFGSNDEAARHYGYSASRFSELVSRWETAGLIPKSRMVGRYKEIASVASAEA